jgi:uncharacterized BrkB/YihY/UPF0761 family membrane protein
MDTRRPAQTHRSGAVDVPGRPTFGIVAAVRPAPAVTSSSMIAVITGSTSAGTNVPHPTRTATGFGHVPGTRLVFTALAVVVSITGMWPVFRWVIARLPRQPVPLRRAMHAAWFGAIGFEILKQAFAIYLDSVTASPPAS